MAWNSGTESRMAGWAFSLDVVQAGEPKRMPPRLLTKNRFIRLEHMLRWVPTAPLGRPVVPDV